MQGYRVQTHTQPQNLLITPPCGKSEEMRGYRGTTEEMEGYGGWTGKSEEMEGYGGWTGKSEATGGRMEARYPAECAQMKAAKPLQIGQLIRQVEQVRRQIERV